MTRENQQKQYYYQQLPTIVPNMPSLTRIAVADRVIRERRSNGHNIRAPSSVGVEIISSAHTSGGGEGMHAEESTLTTAVPVTSSPTNATPEVEHTQHCITTKTPSPSSPPVPGRQSSSEGVSTTHRNKTRSIRHEGRIYNTTYLKKGGVSTYRCTQYLPRGTAGAKWGSFPAAKKINPDAPPLRCPGVLVVDKDRNEKTILIAHECILETSGVILPLSAVQCSSTDSTPKQTKGTRRRDPQSGKTQMKRGRTMWHEGRPYRCTSSNSDRLKLKYRCHRYRPSGGTSAAKSSGSEQAIRWTFYAPAKASNPDAAPYRCPGTLIENRKTNEMTITVPHECTPVHTTTKSKKSASNKDDGRACEYDEPEFESDMFHDGSIAPRKKDALDADASHGDQNVMAGNMESDEGIDAVVDLSIDDDDNNSVSSDKAYYKDMCAALTAALNKRKITEKEARIENRRLRKELKRLRR